MKQLLTKLIFTCAIALFSTGIYAQSLDQAKKLYNEGKYEEAKPAFERLVKQAPNNSSYNHWYGVCCFETGDMVSAEKYLEVAMKRKVQESYRYLGELYIQTYRFEEAMSMFKEYISLLTKKKQDIEPFEARLNTAEKAMRMLEKVENVQIIDSIVINKEDFLSAYVLSEESGSITPFNEFFHTQQNIPSTVYMNQKGDNIYYAHPTAEGNYSLFTQSKLLDDWGDEKMLPSNINTQANENFPFVLSDGVTIYYASDGNGTIGGYDIFVTRYNINSETYLTPEQLGMPYNSPWNDYMMVIDEIKNLGWFASDRFQPEDKVCIYLFIPNENRSRIENEDIETKRARASLASIETTWKPDMDYSGLIQLAHTELLSKDHEIQKDFEFVISNNLVYYTLNEIQSPEARNYYEKVVDLNRQINQVEENLYKLRSNYLDANRSNKEKLKPEILKAEEQLYSLLEQPAGWEKKARNAEINFLRKK